MELIKKLETTVAGWVKDVPHLPAAGQKWLGENVWWIVLIGAILSGIAFLFALSALFTLIALLGTVSSAYYVVPTVTSWAVVSGVVSLVFLVLQGLILAVAVNPLKTRQKKGWVLLFASWLLNAVAVVVNSILTLSVGGFILGILFGAIGLAIGGYFLFEIHSQFAHDKPVAKKA